MMWMMAAIPVVPRVYPAWRIGLNLVIILNRNGVRRSRISLVAVLVNVLIVAVRMIGHHRMRNLLGIHTLAMMALVIAMVTGLSQNSSAKNSKKQHRD